MQVITQRFAKRTLAAAVGGLALALGAAVAHAGSIDPYPSTHKVSRADPYTDGAKVSRSDPYTDGAKVGSRDTYTDGARVDRRDPYSDGARPAAASQHQARAIPGLFLCASSAYAWRVNVDNKKRWKAARARRY